MDELDIKPTEGGILKLQSRLFALAEEASLIPADAEVGEKAETNRHEQNEQHLGLQKPETAAEPDVDFRPPLLAARWRGLPDALAQAIGRGRRRCAQGALIDRLGPGRPGCAVSAFDGGQRLPKTDDQFVFLCFGEYAEVRERRRPFHDCAAHNAGVMGRLLRRRFAPPVPLYWQVRDYA